MDLITTAIVAALSAGAVSGLTEVSKTAITDAYQTLKDLLIQKFRAGSEVVQAIDRLEAKPESAGRQEILQEEMAAVKAEQDSDVLHAAQILLHVLQVSPEGAQHLQTATGNYIAQADRGSNASVNIGRQLEY